MLDFPEINNVAAAALFGSISFLPPLRFVTERRLGSLDFEGSLSLYFLVFSFHFLSFLSSFL